MADGLFSKVCIGGDGVRPTSKIPAISSSEGPKEVDFLAWALACRLAATEEFAGFTGGIISPPGIWELPIELAAMVDI